MFAQLRDAVPRPALLLGVAGLIPFAAGALAVWLRPDWAGVALQSQLAYGACILAFLGGIHWGFALGPDGPAERGAARRLGAWLALATLPAILAWLSLLMAPPTLAMTAQTGLFVALMVADTRAARHRYLPAWYPDLRQAVTLVVVLLLGLTLLGVDRAGVAG